MQAIALGSSRLVGWAGPMHDFRTGFRLRRRTFKRLVSLVLFVAILSLKNPMLERRTVACKMHIFAQSKQEIGINNRALPSVGLRHQALSTLKPSGNHMPVN